MGEETNKKTALLKEKINKLLAEYRLKHDELELATEEWDIGEIQVTLEEYTKEIHKLKKQLHALEEA